MTTRRKRCLLRHVLITWPFVSCRPRRLKSHPYSQLQRQVSLDDVCVGFGPSSRQLQQSREFTRNRRGPYWRGLTAGTVDPGRRRRQRCCGSEPSGMLLGGYLDRSREPRGMFGSLLGASWRLPGSLWRRELVWIPLGAVLEASGAVLEASRAVLRLSLVVSGLSWRLAGPCWGDPWDLLGCFGASGSRKGENAQICEQLQK